MKALKISVMLAITIMLTVCVLTPISSAASIDESGSALFSNEQLYSYHASIDVESYVSSCWYYDDVKYEEFKNAIKGEGEIPASLYKKGDIVPAGDYWLISYINQIVIFPVDGERRFFNLDKIDGITPYHCSFFMLKDNSATITYNVGDHKLNLTVLVLDAKSYQYLETFGVNSYLYSIGYYKPTDMKVLQPGDNEYTFTHSFSNTETYKLYVVYDSRGGSSEMIAEVVDYSLTVDGLSLPSDSTALSYAIIGISLILLAGLLYIANRKVL